jgi:hypothetical protein
MTCQPALDGRVLMGGVIIQNDVNVLAQRNFPVDLLEKFQPLAVGTVEVALFQWNSTPAFHAAWTSKHPSTFSSECHYYLRDARLD